MNSLKYLYVYILRCSDSSYYTGVTNNPEKRLLQHQVGVNKDCYTFSRRPVEIVYCEYFTDYNLAIEWEKRIKKWSKKKKEALINSDWERIKIEARCKNETSHENYK